jgi:hypothetical protein
VQRQEEAFSNLLKNGKVLEDKGSFRSFYRQGWLPAGSLNTQDAQNHSSKEWPQNEGGNSREDINDLAGAHTHAEHSIPRPPENNDSAAAWAGTSAR